jgi:uncharacterized membrane protein
MEIVVLLASLKYFFVEGGEQFIVGLQTAKKIGVKPTLIITITGVSFAVVFFFLIFIFRVLIPTKWLEVSLGITLYYFAYRMFREVIHGKQDNQEIDVKSYRFGYIYLVGLESIENSSALAALTFVDISGALVGAFVSIVSFAVIAIKSRALLAKIPLEKVRIISGALLVLTATPLIIYSSGIATPLWLHWIIPPLE